MTTTKLQEIIFTTCECQRCAHLWPTKLQGRKPLICPKCRSVSWDTDEKFVSKRETARVQALLKTLKAKEAAVGIATTRRAL